MCVSYQLVLNHSASVTSLCSNAASANNAIESGSNIHGLIVASVDIVSQSRSERVTGDIDIEILRNPTGGTVVSDANVCNSVNMNFSSNNEIGADVFYGGEGKTLTGNDNAIVSKTTADNRLLLGIKTELGKGASLGIRLTPPTGNTSMDVNTVIEAYEKQG